MEEAVDLAAGRTHLETWRVSGRASIRHLPLPRARESSWDGSCGQPRHLFKQEPRPKFYWSSEAWEMAGTGPGLCLPLDPDCPSETHTPPPQPMPSSSPLSSQLQCPRQDGCFPLAGSLPIPSLLIKLLSVLPAFHPFTSVLGSSGGLASRIHAPSLSSPHPNPSPKKLLHLALRHDTALTGQQVSPLRPPSCHRPKSLPVVPGQGPDGPA